MKNYHHLTQTEQDRIQALLDSGHKQEEIAQVLERDSGTISREIARNRKKLRVKGGTRAGPYLAGLAQIKSRNRRRYAKFQWKKINKNDGLREYIVAGLEKYWSPDEISGRMKRENQSFYASKTAIYEWLYGSRAQQYCVYLYSQRYRPRKRTGKKTKRIMIPNRVSVHLRPLAAAWQPDHCEADTIVSGKKTGSRVALSVLFERQARYTDF